MNAVFPGFFLFQQIRDADLQIFIDSNRNLIADFPWVRYKHFDVHVFDDGKFQLDIIKKFNETIKYVILNWIEVVIQGDGFCIRGSRMSEKNYETSELKELKDVLQTFTEFVWEMEEYLPEFYHFFDAMRQNIEIFLRVGEEDEEQIHEILERDWEKAHAPLVGVQCYDFQGSHPEAEAGTCVYFANLLTEIGRFFEPMSMLGVL